MMKNSLKEKLKSGKCVYGPFMMTASTDTAEILANVGCDMIMIDGEHGAMGFETAGKMISQIKYTQTTPLLRVPWNDLTMVKQGLDTGASGIMIPMINSKEEAERAIQYCHYPPNGVRGFGAGRASLFGINTESYWEYAKEELLVILQVEHVKAVENIDEILSVPGIDVVFIGPMDLSVSMGVKGELDHPDMQAAYSKVLDACQKHNIVPGIMTQPNLMKKHIDLGFRFLLGGIDAMFIHQGAKQLLEEFKSSINS
ncbi:2-keto-3-deoxy-L-rhamnonate aldolase RhmA [Lysinibacillus composti]|uniref:2,4-dihydroxyhept-2-ene-1,7-dioic acid aldolase n=1 Tax=Lysinibacillus composti TaxID=720633 RepID=A0A3N9UEW5_9BACI|nr:aldolase/citrate lyase family protein [Lysinibacillus composti]MBM7608430.1 2-keto-3-deoxy-L-rhamnonate aldolase RhmA [Lysinibacillus composti]RQW74728.1 2,4-dihydroxyhept-2-ene-1,7-dioic acid aldolase [Lysinibacillus composti]